jgi:hypothetical protein
MLMGKVTLTLKRVVECAPFKTLKEISGRGFGEIFRSTTCNQIERS